MGLTYANGSITGNAGTREYDFLVDTGSTRMTLPQIDIDELGLDQMHGQEAIIETPTDVISRPFYSATGMLEGVAFQARVVPARRPMVGYELLQELGFLVDLASERIIQRTDFNPGLL